MWTIMIAALRAVYRPFRRIGIRKPASVRAIVNHGGYDLLNPDPRTPGLVMTRQMLGGAPDATRADPGAVAQSEHTFLRAMAELMQADHDAAQGPGLGKKVLTWSFERFSQPCGYTIGDLHAIIAPTLIMVGDRDPFCSIDEGAATYRVLPDAEFAVLPHTATGITQPPCRQRSSSSSAGSKARADRKTYAAGATESPVGVTATWPRCSTRGSATPRPACTRRQAYERKVGRSAPCTCSARTPRQPADRCPPGLLPVSRSAVTTAHRDGGISSPGRRLSWPTDQKEAEPMDSAQDTRTGQVLACEESFFSALLAADHQTLATILADDFVIVDVMSGQAARREDLLGAIRSGELQFADVRQYTEERSVRHRDSLAVVIGRTQMLMRYQGREITAKSRYTHVFTRENGRWRLMSAQGTPVAG
jgi:ketosteroid isomerase-like protein